MPFEPIEFANMDGRPYRSIDCFRAGVEARAKTSVSISVSKGLPLMSPDRVTLGAFYNDYSCMSSHFQSSVVGGPSPIMMLPYFAVDDFNESLVAYAPIMREKSSIELSYCIVIFECKLFLF